MRHLPRRVVVLGPSGSGKSTVAQMLAARFGLPCRATDRVFWQAGWQPTPEHAVRAWLREATTAAAWVLDGNFVSNRDVLWARADLAVWLDMPAAMCVWRVARRNLGWWWRGERAWGVERMTLGRACGGIRHVLRTHASKRREYPQLLAGYPELTVIRLTSRREVDRWLLGTTSSEQVKARHQPVDAP